MRFEIAVIMGSYLFFFLVFSWEWSPVNSLLQFKDVF